MREIRCIFNTVRLVHTTSIGNETIVFYRDEPTIVFDILHDYLKLFWGIRTSISYVEFKIHIDGERIRKIEEHVKGMIDSTLNQCDGSIPQTSLEMSLLIDKVKQIKLAASRMGPGGKPEIKE